MYILRVLPDCTLVSTLSPVFGLHSLIHILVLSKLKILICVICNFLFVNIKQSFCGTYVVLCIPLEKLDVAYLQHRFPGACCCHFQSCALYTWSFDLHDVFLVFGQSVDTASGTQLKFFYTYLKPTVCNTYSVQNYTFIVNVMWFYYVASVTK